MSEAPETPNEFNELRRQARLNQLRLKIARQNEALSALRREGYRDTLEGSFYDGPSNYFDIRDYLVEPQRFGGAIPTTLGDRDEGRNFPIFRTEQELAVIRGAARLLTANNPIAVGVLASLTNYVIGNGFQFTTTPRRANAGELATTATAVIDEFLTENDWSGDLDRELFQRSRIDGEYFLGLWHVGNGHVQARAIEPDQVTEPGNKTGLEEWLACSQMFTSNWSFGVHTDENDAQSVHGFYVQWSNRDTEWDYFPGGNEPIIPPQGSVMWLEHAKLNVVRSVKRGLSDFFPIDGNLDLARRVLRNMGEGSAVQAAIAWIQEVAPGTTQAQVSTGTLSRADASYTTRTQQGASRTHYVQQYDPATILKVPSGQKYLPGPLGAQHAPNFITAAEALLRTVALRWNLPEHLVTGSAANNNFASSLVAETPFVKYAESQQQFYAQRDRKTLWRVLWFAWSAGRFGDVPWPLLKRSLEITVTPPQIEVRDPEKETRVRQMLHTAGILSRKTWSAQESLDFDEEQRHLNAESAANGDSVAPGGGRPTQRSGEPPGRLAESLEWWDPEKHPRGFFIENSGWFSPTGGAAGAAVSPTANVTKPKAAELELAKTDSQGRTSTVANSKLSAKPAADAPRSAPSDKEQAGEQDREFAKRAQGELKPNNYGSKEWFLRLVQYAEGPNKRELAAGSGITKEDIEFLDKREAEIAAYMSNQAWELAAQLLRTGAAPDQKTAIMMAAKQLYNARYNAPTPNGEVRSTNPATIEQKRYATYKAGQMLAGQSAFYSFLEDILLPASVNPNAANFDNAVAAAAPLGLAAAAARQAATQIRNPETQSPSGKTPRQPGSSRNVQNGNLFNRVRRHKYAHNEVYIENPKGGYYILDSYDPKSGEIVSRKMSQLSEISKPSAIAAINEAATKYPPGATIANVPSSGALAGQELRGTIILEVPVQSKPVPNAVIDAATKAGVIIRDVNGTIYNP